MTKNKSSTESASTIVSSPPLQVHQVGGPIGDGRSPSNESSVDQGQNNGTPFQHKSSQPAYLVLFLQSLSELGELFWDHGEMGGALLNADFSIHTDFGTIHTPCPNIGWKSGRLLAGTIVPGAVSSEGDREFYLFYGGSPGGDGLLTEEIALAKLTITASGRLEWEDLKTVELLGWEKYYDYSTHPEKPEITHRQKRDPFVVVHDGLYWMFTSAAVRTTSDVYKGCVGLAVSDHVEGPYKAVRSPFFPHLLTANGEEGLCYDCERPHVFFHSGHWHLFFSAREPLTKVHLLQGDGAPLNDSSLHHYQATPDPRAIPAGFESSHCGWVHRNGLVWHQFYYPR